MLPEDDSEMEEMITRTTETLNKLVERIKDLQIRFKAPDLDPFESIQIETEMREIEKLIFGNKELMSILHLENAKTYIVAACLAFLCIVIYAIYVLIIDD